MSASPTLAQNLSRALIADYGSSVQNELGGYYRCLGGTPAQIYDQLVPLGEPKSDAWRIDLTNKAQPEQLGVLLPLFDELTAKGSTPYISFRSRLVGTFIGELGNRTLLVDLVSAPNMETVGNVLGQITSDQLSASEWAKIQLPAPRGKKRIDAKFLRIRAEGNGPCWFAIDQLAFSMKGKPAEKKPLPPVNKQRKALWHWNSAETLPDESRVAALLELCQSHGITDLYSQILYSYEGDQVQLRQIDEQRKFNSAAAARGIAVHALDGAPEYVLAENHSRMIHWTEAIGKLNRQWLPEEGFHGIHLDNEPYVLPQWRDDARRPSVIVDYIDLNQRLSKLAAQYNLEFGVDIPFWWDLRDEVGHAKFTYRTAEGSVPILRALFPLIDNVGIMSYRDRVTGPNGLIALCNTEFQLGREHGVDVLAAAELGAGDDVEPGTTFGVYPWPYFRSQLTTLEKILPHTPGCAGIAIHYAAPFAEAMK